MSQETKAQKKAREAAEAAAKQSQTLTGDGTGNPLPPADNTEKTDPGTDAGKDAPPIISDDEALKISDLIAKSQAYTFAPKYRTEEGELVIALIDKSGVNEIAAGTLTELSAKYSEDAADAKSGENDGKTDQEAGNAPDKSTESGEPDTQKDPEPDQKAPDLPKSDAENAGTAKKDDEKGSEDEKSDAPSVVPVPLNQDVLNRLNTIVGAVQSSGYRQAGKLDDGAALFVLLDKDGNETQPATLEQMETSFAEWRAEQQAQADRDTAERLEDEYQEKLGKWIEDRIALLCQTFGAEDFELVDVKEGEDQIIVLLGKNEETLKTEEIVRGTLTELEDLADGDALERAKAPIDTAEMKVRYCPMSRRRPIRVIKAFGLREVLGSNAPDSIEDRQYEPGEVFDWAEIGLKPFFLSRLYSRKLIRHVQQDNRTPYPFRPSVRPQKPEPPVMPTSTVERDPVKEPMSQTEINERQKQAEDAKKSGRKFTRKGEQLK